MGGARTGHVASPLVAPSEYTSPTGRWRSRRYPPPTLKFQVCPGLRHQVCLGCGRESPSPVPAKKIIAAPDAPRYESYCNELFARKRSTTTAAALTGRRFVHFVTSPVASPVARSALSASIHSAISSDRQRGARLHG